MQTNTLLYISHEEREAIACRPRSAQVADLSAPLSRMPFPC